MHVPGIHRARQPVEFPPHGGQPVRKLLCLQNPTDIAAETFLCLQDPIDIAAETLLCLQDPTDIAAETYTPFGGIKSLIVQMGGVSLLM